MLTRPTRWFGNWGHPHLSDESLVELHALLVAGEHSVAVRAVDRAGNGATRAARVTVPAAR